MSLRRTAFPDFSEREPKIRGVLPAFTGILRETVLDDARERGWGQRLFVGRERGRVRPRIAAISPGPWHSTGKARAPVIIS